MYPVKEDDGDHGEATKANQSLFKLMRGMHVRKLSDSFIGSYWLSS